MSSKRKEPLTENQEQSNLSMKKRLRSSSSNTDVTSKPQQYMTVGTINGRKTRQSIPIDNIKIEAIEYSEEHFQDFTNHDDKNSILSGSNRSKRARKLFNKYSSSDYTTLESAMLPKKRGKVKYNLNCNKSQQFTQINDDENNEKSSGNSEINDRQISATPSPINSRISDFLKICKKKKRLSILAAEKITEKASKILLQQQQQQNLNNIANQKNTTIGSSNSNSSTDTDNNNNTKNVKEQKTQRRPRKAAAPVQIISNNYENFNYEINNNECDHINNITMNCNDLADSLGITQINQDQKSSKSLAQSPIKMKIARYNQNENNHRVVSSTLTSQVGEQQQQQQNQTSEIMSRNSSQIRACNLRVITLDKITDCCSQIIDENNQKMNKNGCLNKSSNEEILDGSNPLIDLKRKAILDQMKSTYEQYFNEMKHNNGI
jgi:hypothetical protein